MSVISCRKKAESDSGSKTLNDSNQVEREFSDTYVLLSNSASDTADIVEADPRLPTTGSRYGRSSVPLKGKSSKSIGPREWEVVCTYSYKPGKGQDLSNEKGHGGSSEDPCQRPPERRYSTGEIAWTPTRDIEDKPIVNSAGEPYATGVSEPRYYDIYIITRNEYGFDQRAIGLRKMRGCTNKADFGGFKPGEVLFAKLDATEQHEGGVTFWKVTYELHSIEGGWNAYKLDEGNYYWSKDPDTGEKIKTIDPGKKGETIHSPIMLDGSGGKLPATFRDRGLVVFNEIKTKKQVDFSVLNLE